MDYDKWPTKNPWRITSSTASDLETGDLLYFALDSSNKIYIQTVVCPSPLGHSPVHTGNDWQDQLCTKDPANPKKVSGNRKSSMSFTIENSAPGGIQMLTCDPPGDIMQASWTAIEGGNGSGSGHSRGGGSSHG